MHNGSVVTITLTRLQTFTKLSSRIYQNGKLFASIYWHSRKGPGNFNFCNHFSYTIFLTLSSFLFFLKSNSQQTTTSLTWKEISFLFRKFSPVLWSFYVSLFLFKKECWFDIFFSQGILVFFCPDLCTLP